MLIAAEKRTKTTAQMQLQLQIVKISVNHDLKHTCGSDKVLEVQNKNENDIFFGYDVNEK